MDRILEVIALGASEGQAAGLKREAQLFAESVCDPECGPPGIRAFLERRLGLLALLLFAGILGGFLVIGLVM